MNELELKFRLDDAAALRWREMFKAQGARRVRMRARYFDTEDGQLGNAQLALRLRQEGRRWVQTLKAAGDSPVHRLEHEVVVPVPAGQTPSLELSRHDGTPALERLRDTLAAESELALAERHATDVWRSRLLLQEPDGGRIEAALDIGNVRAGERSTAIAELELEHLEGPVDILFRRADDAVASGGMWLSTISKAERGERLRDGSLAPATKAQPMRLPSHVNGAALLRGVLLNALAQTLPNLSAVAEGSSDAEHIHQARVGLRRLRTALRELSAFSNRIDPGWEPLLARVFALLGAQRDNEAVAASVQPLLKQAGAPKTMWSEGEKSDTVSAVRAPDFQRALVRVLALAHADDSAYADLPHHEVEKALTQRLHRLHRQVLRAGKHFTKLTIEEQHRARKRLKRLRYLTEFTLPIWPHKAGASFIDALKPAQEALGWHADCAVAAERFAQDAKTDPAAQFASGYLKAHLATTARAAGKSLRKLDDVKPPWKTG